MAYDAKLAARLRALVSRRRGATEKAMFGGLAFLAGGRMFCGVIGGDLMARVGPDAYEAALSRPHARVMDFNGRPMRGYVFVGPAGLTRRAELARWVDECWKHAAALARSKPRRARPRPPGARAARRAGRRAS